MKPKLCDCHGGCFRADDALVECRHPKPEPRAQWRFEPGGGGIPPYIWADDPTSPVGKRVIAVFAHLDPLLIEELKFHNIRGISGIAEYM
jgi:hypothetical protein